MSLSLSLTYAFLLLYEDNFLAKLLVEGPKEKEAHWAQPPTVRSPSQPQSPTFPTQVSTASSGPVMSSESYTFHDSCGSNVVVILAGKKAKRIE